MFASNVVGKVRCSMFLGGEIFRTKICSFSWREGSQVSQYISAPAIASSKICKLVARGQPLFYPTPRGSSELGL